MGEGEQKGNVIAMTLANIERQFGKGAVMRLGDKTEEEVPVISSGTLSLDLAIGAGGFPRGRIIEIYGPESSGKTTLTLHAIAQAQRQGGTCAFIDVEHAFDPIYAQRLGIQPHDLLVSQPDYGEQALEICDHLVRSGAIDLIVVDSVAALVPKAELMGEMGDSHVGLQARLMSQALRKLTSHVNRSNCCVIFINQVRMKIGVVYGNPETTTGGNALKFYSSVRLEVRKGQNITKGDEVSGNRMKIKVVKNKVAPPFRTTEVDVMYGQGISYESDLLDLCVHRNIVKKAGTWFSFENERLGQGRDNVRLFLEKNPDLVKKIQEKLLDHIGWSKEKAPFVVRRHQEESSDKKDEASVAPVKEG